MNWKQFLTELEFPVEEGELPRAKVGGRVIRGTLSNVVAKIVSSLVTSISVVFLARWLGPRAYGFIPLTFSVVAIFTIFADFGLASSTSRFIAQLQACDSAQVRGALRESFLLKLALSVAFSLLALSLAQLGGNIMKSPELVPLLQIASLSILWGSLLIYNFRVFQAFLRADLVAVSLVVQSSLTLCLSLLFVSLGWGVTGALWGMVLTQGVVCLAGMAVLGKYLRGRSVAWGSYIVPLITYAVPLMIISSSSYIYYQTGLLLLGYFSDSTQVAYFSVPMRIAELIRFPAESFAVAIAPVFALYLEKQREQMPSLYARSLKYLLATFVPIAVGGGFLAGPTVLLFFGSGYRPSIPILIWLTPFFLFSAVGTVFGYVMDFVGEARFRATAFVLSAVLYCVLNLLIIPRWGGVGAAASMVFSYFGYALVTLMMAARLCRARLTSLTSVSAKVLLASGLLALVLHSLRSAETTWIGLGGGVLLGAVVYVLALIALRAFPLSEIKTLFVLAKQ